MQNPIHRLLILFIIFSHGVNGQNIDNVTSLREIGSDKGIRFYYDNDFFTAQDYYYTQGINLEFQSPGLKNNPLNFLLVKGSSLQRVYGLSIEHNVFTPSSIRHDEILYGDHPFSAFLLFKSYVRSYDSKSGSVVSSSISLGFIGPAAFGKEMQTSIHTWLENLLPLGWDHQIRNDFLLNYQLNYERMIIKVPGKFHFAGVGTVNAGTLRDDVAAGVQIKSGKFYETSDKKSTIFLFGKSTLNCNFYNSTLSGGIFNKKSEYVLSSEEINLFKVQHTLGINIKIRKVVLEYFQSYVSKEFISGLSHRFGGISIGYCF
ncbi:MAG: lipid A deacylase LpxR family protein [Bacteroidetes bacterium]|nr:lipid A deacylase LpxR family protein [Bacteroidota bacterium]